MTAPTPNSEEAVAHLVAWFETLTPASLARLPAAISETSR